MRHEPIRDSGAPAPHEAPDLLGDAMRIARRLAQQEIALAKAELSQSARRAFVGVVMIVVAAFLVLSAMHILFAAIVAGLAAGGLPVWLSGGIVGGLTLAIAILLFWIGKSRLSPAMLKPDRSFRSLRRDINAIKENADV